MDLFPVWDSPDLSGVGESLGRGVIISNCVLSLGSLSTELRCFVSPVTSLLLRKLVNLVCLRYFDV